MSTLESGENSLASGYYTKAEIDSLLVTQDTLISGKATSAQHATLQAEVTGLQASVLSLAPDSHSHEISDVTGLQASLDEKATSTQLTFVQNLLTASINALDLGTDDAAAVAALQTYTAALDSAIDALPTDLDLASKADVGHTHTASNITDLATQYYNKTQTDALLSSVTPEAHTHVESDITDLDKYSQAQINLLFSDHTNLSNNPHGVTKAQVSLGNVENLSVIDLFQTPQAQALATNADLLALEQTVSIHAADTNNPHNVTKAQVSLGNVPNVNFQSLLDAHINATNPHNINLSFFDVYSRAETDARVQLYVDTLRYAFKPTSPTDGAGAVGDLAYHDTGMYFKFGATDWRHILASKTFNDGSPGSSYEVETPKFDVTTPGGVNLFSVDNTTNTTNINTSLVSISNTLNVGGSVSLGQTLNVTGDVSLGNSLNVSNLFAVDKTTNTTNISTANVSIGGATNISNTLNVDGAVSLGSSLNVSNNLHVSSTQVSISTGLNVANNVSIGGNVSISGALSILGNLRATTQNDLVLEAPGAGKSVRVDDDLVITGDLTVQGTNTILNTETLAVEDNIVLLNKNVTGTPALNSGLEVERGTATNLSLIHI